MKILIIITKGNVGGAQMSVLNLAHGLKKTGHVITVGFGYGDFLPDKLGKLNISFTNFKHLKRGHNPINNLLFIKEVKNYLNKNNFDIVHINSSNSLPAGWAAKLTAHKSKTVFTHRGLTLLDANYQKNNYLKFLYKIYFKFFLKYIDEQIFVSQANLDYAKKIKITKRGAIIHNGINTQSLRFYPQDQAIKNLIKQITNYKLQITNFFEAEQNTNNNYPHAKLKNYIIGSIGRLDYAKNYEFIINLFPKILKIKPKAKFIIIGEGAERKKYEKLIAKNNLEDKIFLLGEVKEAHRYIKAFDLFILPSRYEGLSITLIEALFAGVPILASAVGGTPELLEHAQSQLYELDGQESFLNKFKLLSSDNNLRDEISRQNAETAKKFNINKTVEKYLKIYS